MNTLQVSLGDKRWTFSYGRDIRNTRMLQEMATQDILRELTGDLQSDTGWVRERKTEIENSLKNLKFVWSKRDCALERRKTFIPPATQKLQTDSSSRTVNRISQAPVRDSKGRFIKKERLS